MPPPMDDVGGHRRTLSERRRRFLAHAATKAVQRAARRADGQLQRDEVLGLRVQTAEPWKRVAAILVGFLFFGLAAAHAPTSDADVASVMVVCVLALLGMGCIAIGIYGNRQTLGSFLESLGTEAVSSLLDALF